MMRKILITGSGGLLGPNLVHEAEAYGNAIASSRSSGDIVADLSNRSDALRLVQQSQPDWVVHAAGMTDVDYCESCPKSAYRDNVTSIENLVGALRGSVKLLVISTDQVYPDDPGPHLERSADPINVYGRSKLAGEYAALFHPNVTIVRVNFFGRSLTKGRHSLDEFVIANLKKKNKITLFSDIYFSPLHVKTLSMFTFQLLEKNITGTYNLGSRCGMSKADFGIEVANHLRLSTTAATIGRSSDVPHRAPRTKDLRMNVSKIEAAVETEMPTLIDEISKL